jgi:hypothetical protein
VIGNEEWFNFFYSAENRPQSEDTIVSSSNNARVVEESANTHGGNIAEFRL